MDAPEGTNAPMSRPFGPVPMAGEPGRSWNRLRIADCRLRIEVGSAAAADNPQSPIENPQSKSGSSNVLPAPGKFVGRIDRSTVTFIVALV